MTAEKVNPEIVNRLNLVRDALSLNQKEISDRTGVSTMVVSYAIRGLRAINLDLALGLAREFNVNLNWLFLGNGEPFTKSEKGEVSQEYLEVFEKILNNKTLFDKVSLLIEIEERV